MVIVEKDKLFVNRKGEIVADVIDLPEADPMYQQGFRFQDNQGRSYKPNGQYNIRNVESKYDLIRVCG